MRNKANPHSQPELSEEELLLERERKALLRERELELIAQERDLAYQDEETVLLTWKAPSWAFKKRNREYFTTIGAIVLLLSIILFFAGEFLVIAVMWAFAFLAYVFASVEPEEVDHVITNRGIRTGGKFYRWPELGRFWFHEKYGQKMMSVETFLMFPKQLVFVLGQQDEDKIKDLIGVFALHEKPEPGFLDKASSWLSQKVPLES